jgi:hypothetical protein
VIVMAGRQASLESQYASVREVAMSSIARA